MPIRSGLIQKKIVDECISNREVAPIAGIKILELIDEMVESYPRCDTCKFRSPISFSCDLTFIANRCPKSEWFEKYFLPQKSVVDERTANDILEGIRESARKNPYGVWAYAGLTYDEFQEKKKVGVCIKCGKPAISDMMYLCRGHHAAYHKWKKNLKNRNLGILNSEMAGER